MKQICSQKVIVTAKYTVSKAIEIIHSAKRLNSQLFLSKDGITIQATGLSQLVAFFLTLKEGDSFLYIVEGADAESAMSLILPPEQPS
ncbi:HPr family phosphocarrier protein [Fictibacillus sp. JL2B1089]|uniref:HPr family phosphocarrier protein n=1 Tax=Fictibacillus sp. JL2B1089 TaxID=3399565 RepID=UPI003A84A521